MIRWRLLLFIILVHLGAVPKSNAAEVSADWQRLVAAAKKEGKVVIGAPPGTDFRNEAQAALKKRFDIDSEFVQAPGPSLMSKIVAEKQAGAVTVDAFLIGPCTGNSQLKSDLYEPLAPVMILPEVKDSAKWFGGHLWADNQSGNNLLYSFVAQMTPSIYYNTNLVKPQEVRSYNDLLDAKWQGKISMPDPSRHASTAQYLWNLQQIKGEKWLDFAKGLAQQKPLLVESYSTVPNAIVRGEALLGITYIQYAGQTKGPISFAPINQVFADPSDAALSAKAANSNAAKLFVEYLCSPEGQKKVAETGEFVLSPGIFPAIQGADKIVAGLYMLDDPSADMLAKLQSNFRQLFLAK